MKFYVVGDEQGHVYDCTTTRAEAETVLRANVAHGGDKGGTVTLVDCPVNAKTIQALLGNIGGYANYSKEILRIDPQ
jgi:hypothetical protein